MPSRLRAVCASSSQRSSRLSWGSDLRGTAVGERGFEPPAPTSQTWCSAWLSYSPETNRTQSRRVRPLDRGWLSVALDSQSDSLKASVCQLQGACHALRAACPRNRPDGRYLVDHHRAAVGRHHRPRGARLRPDCLQRLLALEVAP